MDEDTAIPDNGVNQATVDLIKRNEGCRLDAYQDSIGVWTIGYGHTGMVHPGMTVSQNKAEELLVEDLKEFEDGVADALGDNAASNNQFGAMVSLAYNVGLGNFNGSSVLRDHLAGNFQAAADDFLKWDHAGGRVLAGLARRRAEERQLYLTPDAEEG